MIEIWVPVPQYEGFYEASSLGRIRSVSRPRTPGKVLVPTLRKDGRTTVKLSKNGVAKTKRVAQLIAAAFHGPPCSRNVLHWDDNPSNNTPTNLRYGSLKENGEDMVRNGNSPRGEKQGRSVLTRDDVIKIRGLLSRGSSLTTVATTFKVSRAQISKIKKGTSWGWLQDE